MLIFGVCVLLFVLGFVCWILGSKIWNFDEDSKRKSFANSFKRFMDYNDEIFYIGGELAMFIFGMFTLPMLIIICLNAIEAPTKALVYQEQYKALTYKVESGACRDDFGLLSKEVIDEIQEWNTDLIYKKQMSNNIFVGIFYPNVYDGLDTIDYEKYNHNLE